MRASKPQKKSHMAQLWPREFRSVGSKWQSNKSSLTTRSQLWLDKLIKTVWKRLRNKIRLFLTVSRKSSELKLMRQEELRFKGTLWILVKVKSRRRSKLNKLKKLRLTKIHSPKKKRKARLKIPRGAQKNRLIWKTIMRIYKSWFQMMMRRKRPKPQGRFATRT